MMITVTCLCIFVVFHRNATGKSTKKFKLIIIPRQIISNVWWPVAVKKNHFSSESSEVLIRGVSSSMVIEASTHRRSVCHPFCEWTLALERSRPSTFWVSFRLRCAELYDALSVKRRNKRNVNARCEGDRWIILGCIRNMLMNHSVRSGHCD